MCPSKRVMPSFVRITLVLDTNHSSSLDVWLQAFVEIRRTPCAIDDRHDQQQKCDDSKRRQTFARGLVILHSSRIARVVHANQLEKEVSHGREIENNRAAHS